MIAAATAGDIPEGDERDGGDFAALTTGGGSRAMPPALRVAQPWTLTDRSPADGW